jgi:hypothetical protein
MADSEPQAHEAAAASELDAAAQPATEGALLPDEQAPAPVEVAVAAAVPSDAPLKMEGVDVEELPIAAAEWDACGGAAAEAEADGDDDLKADDELAVAAVAATSDDADAALVEEEPTSPARARGLSGRRALAPLLLRPRVPLCLPPLAPPAPGTSQGGTWGNLLSAAAGRRAGCATPTLVRRSAPSRCCAAAPCVATVASCRN